MDKFQINKEIGQGSFSDVLQAQNKQTGDIVAIKRMKRKFQTWEECINLREIKSLRKIEHPNIIKMKEVIKEKDELYLVFEYQEQNVYQLYQIYKEKGQFLQEKQIQTIIYQTISALAHMHKHGFFHRDMKPENMLINEGNVKICDFGLAREIRSRPPFTDYVSTRWYRAPEIILKANNYNSPVDIFALGCIMAELYLMSPLFCGSSEIDQLNKICQILGAPTQWPEGQILMTQNKIDFNQYNPIPLDKIIHRASPEAIQLITEMLRWDPSKRPTAQQILKHEFFNDYDQDNSKLIKVEKTENQKNNRISRDFKKMVSKQDESFNLSQLINESQNSKELDISPMKMMQKKETKVIDEDSFNLSEIMEDLDKIQTDKQQLYDISYNYKQSNNPLEQIMNKNKQPINTNINLGNNLNEYKFNADLKYSEQTEGLKQSGFQNTTNRNALKFNPNNNNNKIYQINYQNNNDEMKIKGRYKVQQ